MTIVMAVINGHLLWSLSLSVLRLTALQWSDTGPKAHV